MPRFNDMQVRESAFGMILSSTFIYYIIIICTYSLNLHRSQHAASMPCNDRAEQP